jgi:hypothetical protein
VRCPDRPGATIEGKNESARKFCYITNQTHTRALARTARLLCPLDKSVFTSYQAIRPNIRPPIHPPLSPPIRADPKLGPPSTDSDRKEAQYCWGQRIFLDLLVTLPVVGRIIVVGFGGI